MDNFLILFQYGIDFFTNIYVSVSLNLLSFFILAGMLTQLTKLNMSRNRFIHQNILLFFLIVPIVAIMTENIGWIFKFLMPKTPAARSIICIAWIFSSLKLHSLAIFLETLTKKKSQIGSFHKIIFALEVMLSVGFVINTAYIIMYNEPFKIVLYMHYALTLFWLVRIANILHKLTQKVLPIVLKKQLHAFLLYFILPHAIALILEYLPIIFFEKTQAYIFSNLSIIIIVSGFYFCFKQIMQFRFLNFSDHVQALPAVNISTNFKNTIDQIHLATHENELEHIAQHFFSEQFLMPKSNILFFIRSKRDMDGATKISHASIGIKENGISPLQKKIEDFLMIDQTEFSVIEMLLKHKILVLHEIEFDEFYSDSLVVSTAAQFLRDINCEVFIPIVNNKIIIGYIVVIKDVVPAIYNQDQQDKMAVFSQFVAPALFMLQNNNMFMMLQESKEIQNELYAKHQEINQYKESIKKLLKDRVENHIGVIFYKGKRFHFKNVEAQRMLMIDPNLETQSPTTATLINFAQQVEKFQTVQSMHMTTANGNKLIISGMLQVDGLGGGVLLILRTPEATDIIKMQIDALKDPSMRDYLLYLETTQAGQAVNKLIPSNSERLLNLKIAILQASMQKDALLLEVQGSDIDPTVEVLRMVSGKESLHVITLQSDSPSCSVRLFGVNQMLSVEHELSLLERHNAGMILIKNIEFLDHVTQQKLAYFIRYGIFTPLKSEQRKFSDARIIFSTNGNLSSMAENNIIIPELYQALKSSSLTIPSLVTLEDQELSQIIDGFMYQLLQQQGSKHLTPLTFKEKEVLISQRIGSLFQLKQKVNVLMSAKNNNLDTANVSPSKVNVFDVTCPEIQLASQLGKHALKDIGLMTTLWKKLGSQTRIADLLGVNRSSVNRRIKDYRLI